MLPVDVIKKQGSRREQVDHPSEFLLNAEANYKATAFDFTQILVTSAIKLATGATTVTSLTSNLTWSIDSTLNDDNSLFQIMQAYEL